MARPRSTAKDQAILEAAVRLFLERGVRGTTMQDIAAQAQVAVGTLYVYFEDKVALVRRVAYAFAERHEDFARTILESRRQPLAKLNAYVLGFYDMWQPFGRNTQGPIELADAVLRYAPETPGMAEQEFRGTISRILAEARESGLRVEKPADEARWIALCTSAFFPLAGTPSVRPLQASLTRNDLQGLLRWLGRKLR